MFKSASKFSRPSVTLYKNQKDLKNAITSVIEFLNPNNPENLTMDKDGFFSVLEVCEVLKEKHPELSYINRNHIIELFFKDRDRKILINEENQIKYKEIRYVQPPDVLYFGTLKNLSERMVSSGLKSKTKGYIKLYDTPEKAKNFASKFAVRDDDEVVVMEIDAAGAFSEGMKFSTYNEGEYIIVRVDRKFILNASS